MAEFKDVMKKYKEICDCYKYCERCPLGKLKYEHECISFMENYPEEAEAVIMAWEKPIDWSKIKVDTKILVKQREDNGWTKRHFAKFENGKVYVWRCGLTSYTATHSDSMSEWDFAKLAEEGEQNK